MDTLSTAKLACFFVGLGYLAYVSRASLIKPRSHGFFRFLAWITILASALLTTDVWFRDPFAWHQLISWLLLAISAFLVIVGVRELRLMGQPTSERDDALLVAFEKTTVLVTTGVFGYIRHPLYSSLLFLAWGIFFKGPSWLGGLLALATTMFLMATARVEERENDRFFGAAYAEYVKQTRMFVPFLF